MTLVVACLGWVELNADVSLSAGTNGSLAELAGHDDGTPESKST